MQAEVHPESAMEQALVTRVTRQELDKWAQESQLQYTQLLSYSRCAMHQIESLVRTIDEELSLDSGSHPVDSIQSIVKSPERIADELLVDKLPLTVQNIEQHIQDLATVHLVCTFCGDLYRVSKALLRYNHLNLLSREDTVYEAREDGYRGLRLVLSVPVTLRGRTRSIKVTVVLHTPAMELWCRSEEKFHEAQDVFLPEQVAEELRACAALGLEWDQRLEQIRYNVEHRVITK